MKEPNHKKKGKNTFPYALLLACALAISNPAESKVIDNGHFNTEVVADSSIIKNIEKKIGITLPTGYVDKIQNFLNNSKVIQGNGATFTEEFIINQMGADRGISKENQLLFIYDAIYEQITKNNFYDGDDGDEKRLEEFENVMDMVEDCGKKYKDGFMSYMDRISAEARQQSAEARQQSAEARQQSAEAIKETMRLDSIRIKDNLKEFYNIYTKNPNIVKQEEIDFMKKRTKEVIEECKKYGIDYRAILLKEVGDKKIVDAILRFYGVE